MLKIIKDHITRLSWPIIGLILTSVIAFGFVGVSPANFETILFKFLVFCPALCLVHLSRKALFPYIDLGKLVQSVSSSNATYSRDLKDGCIIACTFAYYIGMTYVLTAVL